MENTAYLLVENYKEFPNNPARICAIALTKDEAIYWEKQEPTSLDFTRTSEPIKVYNKM